MQSFLSCKNQLLVIDQICLMKIITKTDLSKDSFLRALREVAPEMKLFLGNHGQYVYTKSCDKINLHTKLYISPFHKKIVS